METKEFRLGDVCKLRNGYAFKSENFSNTGIPVIRISDIYDDEASPVDSLCTKESPIFENFAIRKGDILIAMSGATTGKFGRYNSDIKAYQNQRVGCFIIKDTEKLQKDYLYILLKGLKKKIEKDAYGGGQPNISSTIIEDYKIHLPSPKNQTIISRLLQKAELVVKLRETSLIILDEFLEMKFLEIFGDPVRNAKNWATLPLSKITTKIGSGSTPRGGKESYSETGISLIRSLNIFDLKFVYKDLAFIDDSQADLLKNVIVQEGDVLINITGASVCRCTIVPSNVLPARVNQHVSILRPNKSLLTSEYLLYTLVSKTFKKSLLKIAKVAGATREALTKEQLENLLIPLPDKDLQEKFTYIVLQAQKVKDLFIKSKTELENLTNSLTQRSLDGKLDIINEMIAEKTLASEPNFQDEEVNINRINAQLKEFHISHPQSSSLAEIDNTIHQLETELKIRGEIPFWEDYVKHRLVKNKFKEPFTFDQLWDEIIKFPFENTPGYDEISTLIFKWLSEKNAFIRQQYNTTTKQMELVINETDKA